MQIQIADSTDATEITALTLRSKAFWNYTPEQIESWKEELTISAAYINENSVYKLVDVEKKLIGFYAYNGLTETKVQLNFLFVEPEFIGKGYGTKLLDHFKNQLANTNFTEVTLDADPNAENFYAKHGFEVVGKLPSSIKNRYLPIMEFKL